jgi:hypothetical protein
MQCPCTLHESPIHTPHKKYDNVGAWKQKLHLCLFLFSSQIVAAYSILHWRNALVAIMLIMYQATSASEDLSIYFSYARFWETTKLLNTEELECPVEGRLEVALRALLVSKRTLGRTDSTAQHRHSSHLTTQLDGRVRQTAISRMLYFSRALGVIILTYGNVFTRISNFFIHSEYLKIHLTLSNIKHWYY